MMRTDSLEMRRTNLCIKFSKKCLRNEKLKNMFPRNRQSHSMEKRSGEKFSVNKAFTERYKRSAIPSMQRLLNSSEKDKMEILKRINSTVPVNYELL